MAEHITIGETPPRIQYLASGTDGSFTFAFPVFRPSDVAVYLDSEEATEGFVVLGAGLSEGGTVVFDTPPPAGTVITLRRRLALGRVTDFQENGEFRAAVLNDELDAQAAGLQQVAEDVSRAIQFGPADTSPPPVLPPREARANRVVGFDAAGALALYPALGGEISGTVQVQAAGTVPRSISEKLSESLSVRDFGAAGNGAADDRAAIQAAFDAAGLAGRFVTIPEGDYAVSGPLLLPAAAAGLVMRGRIVYAAGAPVAVLTLGTGVSGQVQGRLYQGIRVVRQLQSGWSSEADIGVVIRTPNDCTIEVAEAAGFTIGVRLVAEGGAATGSALTLGRIANNRIGLDLRSGNSTGSIAAIRVLGGRFVVASAVNATSDRFGIRLSFAAAGQRTPDGLVFDAPSFSLGSGTAAAIPFLVETDGRGLAARAIRIEGPSTVIARHVAFAEDHVYEIAAASEPGSLTIEYPAGANRAGGVVVARQAGAPNLALTRTVASVANLRAAAFRWAPGLTGFDHLACLDGSAAPATLRDAARPGLDGYMLGQRGITLGPDRGLGFAVDARRCRSFGLVVDGDPVRLVALCFDAAGALMTDAAGMLVRASTEAMAFDPARGWWAGAGQITAGSRTALPAIHLSALVASAIIGVMRGTADAELRALVLTADPRTAPALLAGLPDLPHGRRDIVAEATWDPPSLAANTTAILSVTVPGAAMGDHVSAAFTLASPNVLLFGTVSAADTVTAVAWNRGVVATDLAGGTLRLRVLKA
ncbi:glycosyl hydrolase family 28-related protein [Elioraea sp.]|uniref:glycosyl hydrolase family 28-related protein n=1 Tax=Elioraea sp. TaxID=2185103 RepID=UPI0025BA0232|nr:glycosyl hydrolase family 28-related protein [Elioraea sp.]